MKAGRRKAQGWAPCVSQGEASAPWVSLGHWHPGFGLSLVLFSLSQEGLNVSRGWNRERLQDCGRLLIASVLLVETIEIIISSHFRDRVRLVIYCHGNFGL